MISIKKIQLVVILLLISPLVCLAKIYPTNDFYVNDYANVLTEDIKQNVINSSEALYKRTGAQIVIVTLNDLGGDSIENVANEIFNSFEIGSKKNNGILILFSKNDRKIRVEIGYGLEETLNDAKVGRMIDQYMIPLFKENKFAEGLDNGYKSFYNYLLDYYNITDLDTQETTNQDNYEADKIASIIATLIFIILIIYLIYASDGYGGGYHGGYHSRSSGGYSGGGGFSGGGGHSGGGGASRGF